MEIGTHLKTVKNTLDIFAVQLNVVCDHNLVVNVCNVKKETGM